MDDGISPGTNRVRFVPTNMLRILPVSARETRAARPRDRRFTKAKGVPRGHPFYVEFADGEYSHTPYLKNGFWEDG